MSEHYDIAICGGGLAGLLLANLLIDSGYQIALLDAGSAPKAAPEFEPASPIVEASFTSGFQPRVSALNANSVQLLEQCGLLQCIPRYAPFREMCIKDSEGTGEISFSAEDVGTTDQLGIVVENHLVIAALYNNLEATNVDLKFNHQLEDLDSEPGEINLFFAEQESISCELLVAADGGNSKVRELAGKKTFGWQYDQKAIVTTLQCEKAHHNIPRQWFTAAGPLAFLPLAEPNLVSIVWSHTDAESILDLPAEEFCDALEQASELDLGRILGTDKRFSFPLRQHHAVKYTEPGIVLIGDAAHTIHPLAGQGANLGLADAAVLASEIRQAIFSDQMLSDPALLRRFVSRRQPHNLAIAAAMEAIKQLYGRQDPVLGLIRNKLMNFLDQNTWLKSLMVKVAVDSSL